MITIFLGGGGWKLGILGGKLLPFKYPDRTLRAVPSRVLAFLEAYEPPKKAKGKYKFSENIALFEFSW